MAQQQSLVVLVVVEQMAGVVARVMLADILQ
jgi:hypothetical protein